MRKTLEAFKMHRTPPPSNSAANTPATSMKKCAILAIVVLSLVTAPHTAAAQAQNTLPDISAIQSRIRAEDAIVGRGIATRDLATSRDIGRHPS